MLDGELQIHYYSFNDSNRVEHLVRSHNARILEIEAEYIVIEKTGHEHETEALNQISRRELLGAAIACETGATCLPSCPSPPVPSVTRL